MTPDDIIRMAREAGFNTEREMIWVDGLEISPYMQRFATLVAAAEREAIADELEHGFDDGNGFHVIYARAIRAGGQA